MFLPLSTAFACGVIFGITAFLLKELTQTVGHGFNPPSQQWPLYAFIIAEPLGFLLNQNAFQESSLIAPVLAIRTVTDPLVAIGIGLVWLNEEIASSPAAIADELAGLVIMSVGVVALAYRSPHLEAATSRPLAPPPAPKPSYPRPHLARRAALSARPVLSVAQYLAPRRDNIYVAIYRSDTSNACLDASPRHDWRFHGDTEAPDRARRPAGWAS